MKSSSSIRELTRRNVETIAQIEKASQMHGSWGDRLADAVAAGVGSWSFIIFQSVVFSLWAAVNVTRWFFHWDPYPFILLNLVLSFQAAFASPIIMMSQNRQARLNERRNKLDLQINLLAEQENTEMLKLLRLLCENSGIPVNGHVSEKVLEERTCPEDVIRQIEAATTPN